MSRISRFLCCGPGPSRHHDVTTDMEPADAHVTEGMETDYQHVTADMEFDSDPNALETACKGCKDFRTFTMDFTSSTTLQAISAGADGGCQSCYMLRRSITELIREPLPSKTVILFIPQLQDKVTHFQMGISIKVCHTYTDLITFYCLPDSPSRWKCIGWNGMFSVPDNNSSPECLDQAGSWIRDCLESHHDCRVTSSQLPSRVIHVGSTGTEPRLYSSNGNHASYVALSYCWGDYHPITTTKGTLRQRERQIPFATMPRLFQDAVIVTRALGIEYLWIDALCIVQDDSSDWELEASRMADVYSHAHVTISADIANDARESILSIENRLANDSISIPCPGPLEGDKSQVYARLQRALGTGRSGTKLGHGSIDLPDLLDTRAWTYQERMLSPRTLHYTADEMVFECRENWRCQCTVQKFDIKDLLFKNQHRDLIAGTYSRSMWENVVQEFTKRNIRHDTDRLPAIAGVASAIEPLYTSDEYLFGIWKSELLRHQLLWRTSLTSLSRRNQARYAPTWSWASVTSRVEFDRLDLPDHSAEIIDIEVLRTSKNPYGPGTGSLTLRGLMLRGTVVVKEFDDEPRTAAWIHMNPNLINDYFILTLDVTHVDEMEVYDGEEVFVFGLQWDFGALQYHDGEDRFYNVRGIGLKPVSIAESTFRRIGCVWFKADNRYYDWTLETVTII